MEYNTNDLGYKLISGGLKTKRKHSEQLNKYLAGLIDSDGSITIRYRKRSDTYTQNGIVINYAQSEINDPNFLTITALKEFYNLGYIHKYKPEGGSMAAQWILKTKDAKVLFNRIGKHLRVKHYHFDNIIWLQEELKYVKLSLDNIVELKEYSKCSRYYSAENMILPKHLSWAYIAGFIAGDGHVAFRPKRLMKAGYTTSEMSFRIKLHKMDVRILQCFKRDFKGTIVEGKDGLVTYRRNLGKQSSLFAVSFLKQVRKYIAHPHKYKRINDIIKFHELNKQQRLNKRKPKGKVIVH